MWLYQDLKTMKVFGLKKDGFMKRRKTDSSK